MLADAAVAGSEVLFWFLIALGILLAIFLIKRI